MLDIAITIKLESDSEPWTVYPTTGTLLAFERHYGSAVTSAGEALATGRLEYVAFLAWESRRKAGHTVPPFDKFQLQIEDLDIDTSAGDRPLAEGQSPT